MFKNYSGMSLAVAAFSCLLLAFISLGTMVVSLASGSTLAVIAGICLVVFMTAAIIGFRMSAVRLANARKRGGSATSAGVFGDALRRDQVDRYLQTYRGAH